MKKVAIIMGSDSDLPVVKKAADTLASFSVPYEMHVYSAHRTPVQAHEFSLNARNNGFGVIIAAAGMAAHLAGSLAANTTLPVIGIPMKSSTFITPPSSISITNVFIVYYPPFTPAQGFRNCLCSYSFSIIHYSTDLSDSVIDTSRSLFCIARFTRNANTNVSATAIGMSYGPCRGSK